MHRVAQRGSVLVWALLPGQALAHGDLGGLVTVGMGVVAGLLASVAAIGWFAMRMPRGVRRIAIMMAMPVLCGVAGGAVGAAAYYVLQVLPQQKRNRLYLDQERAVYANPVYRTVCFSKVAEANSIADAQSMARAVLDCGFASDDGSRHVVRQVMPVLARAPGADRSAGGGLPFGYCHLLEWVHNNHRTDLVRELTTLQLPLSCPDASGKPAWWRGLADFSASGAHDWIAALRDGGLDFGVRETCSGETALDRVVACHEPRIVRIVLERAGVDPRALSGASGGRPPAAWWNLRHFGNPNSLCRLGSMAELAEDIQAIDARMGELTPAMINQRLPAQNWPQRLGVGGTMFWHVPYSDPALFEHLLDKGGDPLLRGRDGETFLHHGDPSPELLNALARLSTDEVRQLAMPALAGSPHAAPPLVAQARQNRRHALVEFLCARGASGC